MASLFIKDNLITEFGEYYLKRGQNKNRLITALVQPSVTLNRYGRRITTQETRYEMANYDFGKVIQPFKKEFTPISSIKFYPNIINLEEMKVDVSMFPHDIEAGYLGFLAGDTTRSMTEWPIIRWLLEEYIAKQIEKDREMSLTYLGKKVPGSTQTEHCMDGIKEKLIKGATADYKINAVTTGALNESMIFNQIEEFDKQIGDLYLNERVTLFVAPKWLRAYKEAKRANGFYQIKSESDIDENIDFSNHVVAALPSMTGTDDIWASVNNNLLWLTKREGNLSQSSIQLHDREVRILLDWWEGLGFSCNQMVWANEAALTATPVTPETSDSGS
jgi:hypothetical protein